MPTGRREVALDYVCVRCGKGFQSYATDKGVKFCGAKCRYAHDMAAARDKRREALRAQPETCPVCDKNFYQGTTQPKIYCSQKCNKKAWKIRNREKVLRDTFYSWAVKKFDGNYLSALGRDGFSCVKCGDPTTTVHHKDNRGDKGKFLEPNHRIENLVTLCTRCHAKEHRIVWVFDGSALTIQCEAFRELMGSDTIRIAKKEVMI